MLTIEEQREFKHNVFSAMRAGRIKKTKGCRAYYYPFLHYINVRTIKDNNENGVIISELVKNFDFTKGRVTQIINEHVEKGLIEKIYLEGNRKKAYVKLTPEGKKAVNDNKKVIDKKFEKLFDKVTENEVKEFNNTMRKIREFQEEELH